MIGRGRPVLHGVLASEPIARRLARPQVASIWLPLVSRESLRRSLYSRCEECGVIGLRQEGRPTRRGLVRHPTYVQSGRDGVEVVKAQVGFRRFGSNLQRSTQVQPANQVPANQATKQAACPKCRKPFPCAPLDQLRNVKTTLQFGLEGLTCPICLENYQGAAVALGCGKTLGWPLKSAKSELTTLVEQVTRFVVPTTRSCATKNNLGCLEPTIQT